MSQRNLVGLATNLSVCLNFKRSRWRCFSFNRQPEAHVGGGIHVRLQLTVKQLNRDRDWYKRNTVQKVAKLRELLGVSPPNSDSPDGLRRFRSFNRPFAERYCA